MAVARVGSLRSLERRQDLEREKEREEEEQVLLVLEILRPPNMGGYQPFLQAGSAPTNHHEKIKSTNLRSSIHLDRPPQKLAAKVNLRSENGQVGPTVRVSGLFQAACGGTSLVRRRPPLGPYSRPLPKALPKFWEGGIFL